MFTSDNEYSKIALLDFVNSVMEFEGENLIEELQIINPEIPSSNNMYKKSIFDIRAKTKNGEQIIIEMQLAKHVGFEQRSQYAISKAYASQEIAGRNYNSLKKCYLLSLVNFNLTDSKEFINDYRFRNKEGKDLCEGETIIFIELSKLDKIIEKDISEMSNIEMWVVFLKYAPDRNKKEIINRILEKKEEINMVTTILNEISQSEKERAVYENELMAEMDYVTDMEDALQRGMEKGMRKGIELIKNMKANGMDIDSIIKYSGLSKEEVYKIIN
jgi:predicted transposase/invertase (TIGR01784 family)